MSYKAYYNDCFYVGILKKDLPFFILYNTTAKQLRVYFQTLK